MKKELYKLGIWLEQSSSPQLRDYRQDAAATQEFDRYLRENKISRESSVWTKGTGEVDRRVAQVTVGAPR